MNFYKNAVLVWLIVYMLFALIGNKLTTKSELFPFFNWSLYSVIPNNTELPYVLVNKIGDSTLSSPVDLRHIKSITGQSVIAINNNINTFYNSFKKTKKVEEVKSLLKLLPTNSEFELLVKEIDLSKKDYKNSAIIRQVLVFKNNKTYLIE